MGQNQLPKLSPRQQQCLRGVAEHLDSQQIGHRLGISSHTVDGHIAAAMTALGASSRRDAVRIWAARNEPDTTERLTGKFLPVDFPVATPPSPDDSGSQDTGLPGSIPGRSCPSLVRRPTILQEDRATFEFEASERPADEGRRGNVDPWLRLLAIPALVLLLAFVIIAVFPMADAFQRLALFIKSLNH
ncbi:MAG: helix-turn-helix domain-containing protein [Sphingomonas sp.]